MGVGVSYPRCAAALMRGSGRVISENFVKFGGPFFVYIWSSFQSVHICKGLVLNMLRIVEEKKPGLACPVIYFMDWGSDAFHDQLFPWFAQSVAHHKAPFPT